MDAMKNRPESSLPGMDWAALGCRVLQILRFLAVLAVIAVPLIAVASGWSWPIFPWLSQGNYAEGLAEFLIGAVGALLAAYLLLGLLLPPTGEVRAIRDELRGLKDSRNALFQAREQYVQGQSNVLSLDPSRAQAADELSDDLENTIGRLEQRLTDERWRFLRLSILLYAAFGGLSSAALIKTPREGLTPSEAWQALMLGFALGGAAIVLVFVKDWLEEECQKKGGKTT